MNSSKGDSPSGRSEGGLFSKCNLVAGSTYILFSRYSEVLFLSLEGISKGFGGKDTGAGGVRNSSKRPRRTIRANERFAIIF